MVSSGFFAESGAPVQSPDVWSAWLSFLYDDIADTDEEDGGANDAMATDEDEGPVKNDVIIIGHTLNILEVGLKLETREKLPLRSRSIMKS